MLAQRTGAGTDRAGRIKVNPDLTVPGFPDVYVAGDLALALRGVPGVAQVATKQGAYAARAITRRICRHSATSTRKTSP